MSKQEALRHHYIIELNKTKSSIHEYEDFDRKYEKIELSQKQKREKKHT